MCLILNVPSVVPSGGFINIDTVVDHTSASLPLPMNGQKATYTLQQTFLQTKQRHAINGI